MENQQDFANTHSLMRDKLDAEAIAPGTPAIPLMHYMGSDNDIGAFAGQTPVAVFSPEDIELVLEKNPQAQPVLIVDQVRPWHLPYFNKIAAIVSLRNPQMPHLALIARNKNLPLILLEEGVKIQNDTLCDTAGNALVRAGDPIAASQEKKSLYVTGAPLQRSPIKDKVADTFLAMSKFANKGLQEAGYGPIVIAGNASDIEDVNRCIDAGLDGVLNFRSEHLYLTKCVLPFQIALLTSQESEFFLQHAKALEAIEVAHKQEFQKIFNLPPVKNGEFFITMRLLDGVPREVIPDPEDDYAMQTLFKEMGIAKDDTETQKKLRAKAYQLREQKKNFGATALEEHLPGFTALQLRATAASVADLPNVDLRIMSPETETALDVENIIQTAKEMGLVNFTYIPMIETVRGQQNSAQIAEKMQEIHTQGGIRANKACFGSNDYTSEFLNLPRTDMEKILAYRTQHKFDPFRRLDDQVAGKMIETQDILKAHGIQFGTPSAQASTPEGAEHLLQTLAGNGAEFIIAGSAVPTSTLTMQNAVINHAKSLNISVTARSPENLLKY